MSTQPQFLEAQSRMTDGQPGFKSKKNFKTMNFEKYAAEGNHFINEVAAYLNVDRNTAARVTRAVLHAVRDRIPPADAIEFAQGLPIAIKGIYFDQYDLARVPVILRHPSQFIDYVVYKNRQSAHKDFPNDEMVEDAIAAVFRVLEHAMDYGQVEQIKRMMNDEIAYLFY
jgi:uncharacterized protein (DUF2267 family)